jgi:Ca2+/H+ antiporter
MKVFALVATVLTLGSYVAADNFANFFNGKSQPLLYAITIFTTLLDES